MPDTRRGSRFSLTAAWSFILSELLISDGEEIIFLLKCILVSLNCEAFSGHYRRLQLVKTIKHSFLKLFLISDSKYLPVTDESILIQGQFVRLWHFIIRLQPTTFIQNAGKFLNPGWDVIWASWSNYQPRLMVEIFKLWVGLSNIWQYGTTYQ